jgi:hypothetical protein
VGCRIRRTGGIGSLWTAVRAFRLGGGRFKVKATALRAQCLGALNTCKSSAASDGKDQRVMILYGKCVFVREHNRLKMKYGMRATGNATRHRQQEQLHLLYTVRLPDELPIYPCVHNNLNHAGRSSRSTRNDWLNTKL